MDESATILVIEVPLEDGDSIERVIDEIGREIKEVMMDELPYTVGQWNGLPNYICKVEGCEFSNPDLEYFLEVHMKRDHKPAPRPEPRPTGLLDSRERPIMSRH